MKKVITYGTYDILHYGHIKLLERAKALGDYLIVAVTSDDFDRTRGKINVKNSLIERVEAVRKTGLADEIIVEEYEGQKIDDIKRYGIDIFTVGSDWEGKFDYLNEFCQVIYLDRTRGVSSSEIRAKDREVRLGILGESHIIKKYEVECEYVNGLKVIARNNGTEPLASFYSEIDAVYIVTHPTRHYTDCFDALEHGKHVLCESPIALTADEATKLLQTAREKGLIIADGIKTAYSTAFSRLILLAKSGKIGDFVSVDSTCTSLKDIKALDPERLAQEWNSITAWGPTALLPVFDLLGTECIDTQIFSRIIDERVCFDDFSKVSLLFAGAVSSSKVGKGVKSEGELIISGTKGYIYVPSPWWKTDYFEIRYENQSDNRRYFYQLEGEGIRNELVSFVRMIEGTGINPISEKVTIAIATIMEKFYQQNNLKPIGMRVCKNVI